MHAALGDTLFAFVAHDQLWLSPTYRQQDSWWQLPLDWPQLHRRGPLEYGHAVAEAYLRARPQEAKRVGQAQILTVLLRVLDPLSG